ncbi:MAG: DUF6179 domain-containing protein [Lachnospiraceae bacterium]
MKNNYPMEELIPIVAELAERFTSKESTSVTYERAKSLMEAVLYCIAEAELKTENGTAIVGKSMTAKQAYEAGYQMVFDKVRISRETYNEMILTFSAYGNENYRDTVEKAIPGFFRYYDARFAPQETIITMDYPTLCPVHPLSGIDAMSKYIEYICLEQLFFSRLPEKYIYMVLASYHDTYEMEFFNICSIVLRNILSILMLQKCQDVYGEKSNCERLEEQIRNASKEELKEMLLVLLENLVETQYEGKKELFEYLSGDLEDFACELYFGASKVSQWLTLSRNVSF